MPVVPPSITLVARLAASATDARRGVVRLHPEVIDALGLDPWDAVTLTGARVTAALVAPSDLSPTRSPGQVTLDDVTLSNAGLTDGRTVVVAPAQVHPARRVLFTGSQLARAALAPETVRLALVGKIVTDGDAVSLLPQDIEPAPGLDVPAARRQVSGALGSGWTTELLTVAGTDPAGPVAVMPTTVVGWAGGPVTGADPAWAGATTTVRPRYTPPAGCCSPDPSWPAPVHPIEIRGRPGRPEHPRRPERAGAAGRGAGRQRRLRAPVGRMAAAVPASA